MKKLKIVGNLKSLNSSYCDLGNVFFDKVDPLLAKEHYGNYIIVTSNNKSSRIYLSFIHKKEYEEARRLQGARIVDSDKKPTQRQLFDLFPMDKKLIVEALNLLILPSTKESTAAKRINGLRVFLICLHSAGIEINSIKEIDDNIENSVYIEFQENKELLLATNQRNLHSFFVDISYHLDRFDAGKYLKASKSKPIKSLPSIVVVQLDYCAQLEIESIINDVRLYQDWMVEYTKIDLFSFENIVKSYLECISTQTSKKFFLMAQELYGVNLKCWEKKVAKKYYYKDSEQENYHKELKEISLSGINIDYDNEKMFAFWHKELFPYYPYNYEICPKYSFLFKSISHFRKNIRRAKTNLVNFEKKIFPSNYELYPLILFLLIRTGKNSEVLNSWEITLNNNGEYSIGTKICGDLLIEGYKSRSNSKERTVLSKGSKELEYVEFYLKWLNIVYKESESKNFFQSLSKENNIHKIKAHKFGKIFSSLKNSALPNYFYVKHKIYDVDGSRFESMDHRRIRSYSNYADYLRGFSEYERSLKKGHKNIDTQVHYENHTEWKNIKKYKIFKTLTALIDFFKGEIIDEKKHPFVNLFNGPLADCINPLEPSYYGAEKLKSNEACVDWFKCLICRNAKVIPTIHGPLIYAWISYMENAKKDFINELDWEKEYFLDYMVAMLLFKSFNDEIKKISISDSVKHEDFIKIKFKKKLKVKAS